MKLKHKAAVTATMAALMGVAGTAQAAFQGRDATGAVSVTCTSTGAGKCTYFYDTTLNITILNNWNIGAGAWSASADPGSVQALAATAGLSTSGLSGWVLPTGDGGAPAGAQNQFLSIWNSVGGNFAGLSGQFDGVQGDWYWSGTVLAPDPNNTWFFRAVDGGQLAGGPLYPMFAVAVRPGDVAAIPEPENYLMMLLGLGALMVAVRKRPR